MFCSCSWPFPLPCLPITPLDIIQITGNLGHYWGPMEVFFGGKGPKHMLGNIECPQVHDLLTTLELPRDWQSSLSGRVPT
jgi:hypothetical protein